MSAKPSIPKVEVEKAQALARHHAGQAARSKGYDPSTLRALATYGKPTTIGEGEEALTLLPQTLQVQLCLMEHAKAFPPRPDLTVADGVERMAHMALIYTDPDGAFEILSDTSIPIEDVRREFRREAFKLSKHFVGSDSIDKLSAHIMAQMQLTDDAAEEGSKKPPPPKPKALGGPRKNRH